MRRAPVRPPWAATVRWTGCSGCTLLPRARLRQARSNSSCPTWRQYPGQLRTSLQLRPERTLTSLLTDQRDAVGHREQRDVDARIVAEKLVELPDRHGVVVLGRRVGHP